MVEEIMPCPNCGKAPQRSNACLYCPSCGFLALEEWWNRLSHAAELARAVDVVETWLREQIDTRIEVDTDEHRITLERLTYHKGVWDCVGMSHAPTFAAALIALAEQVNDASK